MSEIGELLGGLWFLGVLVALGVLFVAGLKLPVPPGGRRRWLARAALGLGAAALTILANMALFRHDAHWDLTREKAFSPSPEARQVVRSRPRTSSSSTSTRRRTRRGAPPGPWSRSWGG